MRCLALLAAAALAAPTLAQEPPTPASVVAAAKPAEWAAIDPADLLVMELAPDAKGKRRTVVIQLMPAPFSQGWVGNIRTLAKAHWWDGTSVYRVVDNWVAQWGDGEEDKANAKPLPAGLRVVPESEYEAPRNLAQLAEYGATDGGKMDVYADTIGFHRGWPVGGYDQSLWPVHCYASVGVARDLSPDTGTGAELYAVIGHAPRQLDRNIAVVGRVIEGIEHLSTLPRGTGEAGVYETEAEHTPVVSVRLGTELREPPRFEYLSSESRSFVRYVEVRAARRDSFYNVPAGGVDLCNVQVPVRRVFAK